MQRLADDDVEKRGQFQRSQWRRMETVTAYILRVIA
jgi:hypothetical protein